MRLYLVSFLVGTIGLAVLAGSSFYILNQSRTNSNGGELSKPWLEVVQPAVFELAADHKTEMRELHTGDELSEGIVIRVSNGGLANIYFPDGSVVRLDEDTRLVLEEGIFDYEDETLKVRINLLWGRVWSKIIGLATPDSHWEVKTSTAVAVVRGTAFGVEYVKEGEANIVGYENKVEVAMVDPDTKEIMKEVRMIVEPEKILAVKKDIVMQMKNELARGAVKVESTGVMTAAGHALMEVRSAPKEILEQAWVKRGIEADKKLEEKIDAMKNRLQDMREIRQELRKELRDQFMEQIQEQREKLNQRKEELKENVKDRVAEEKEVLEKRIEDRKEDLREAKKEIKETLREELQAKTEINKEAIGAAPIQVVRPVGLEIRPQFNLGAVKDGDFILMKAMLLMADGNEVDVTEQVRWQVAGPIGAMERPGAFLAKLHPTVSELGEAPGAVTAMWQDEKTGAAFLAKTPIFKVEMRVDLKFDPTRG